MKVLVRTVQQQGGGVSYADASSAPSSVTIGRATDRTVHIQDRGVPLSHSEITRGGDDWVIRAEQGSLLFVNGKRVTTAKLSPGDLIEVSSTRITMSELVDEEHELVLEVEPGEVDDNAQPPGSQFKVRLEETRLSKRSWSWLLFTGILVLCGIIPAVGLMDPQLAQTLRDTPAPDDGQWDPGPLHPSHGMIGDDCSACHVDSFTMVRDQECMACHGSIPHHVDPAIHDIADLEETRCATCHKEHNEPRVLVRGDQGLCTDCHGDLQGSTDGPVELANATDFLADHPAFKVSVLAPAGGADATTWMVERTALAEQPAEDSNLIFPHDVHLADAGVSSPWGDVQMVCSDCHEPETDGAHMRPIRMDDHCADCHRLEFDPDDPERVVPHGRPDEVVQILKEYYAAKFLEDRITDQPSAPVQSRRQARRPGQARMGSETLSPVQRAMSLDTVIASADRAASDIFERRTCAICHEITIDDSGEHLSKWRVEPVALTRVWMPKAWFDHKSHLSETCESCHDAEQSTVASDVLMPDIDNCQQCHGGEHADNLLASSCITCHEFHLDRLPLMRPWVEGAREPLRQSPLSALRGSGSVRSTRKDSQDARGATQRPRQGGSF